VAHGEGDRAGAAGLPADPGWERLERGRRILGAFRDKGSSGRDVELACQCHGVDRAYGCCLEMVSPLAPVDRWIGELPGEDQRCLLFAAAEGLSTRTRWNALAECLGAGAFGVSIEQRCFRLIAELGLELDAADVRLLGAVAGPQGPMVFELALHAAARLIEEGAPGAQAAADALADRALDWNPMYRIKARARHPEGLCVLRDAALDLAVRPPAPPEMEGPVSRDDGYGRAVIAFLGPVEDWPAGVQKFLSHCRMSGGTGPSASWQRRCARLAAALEDAPGLVRHLLELVVTTPPLRYQTEFGPWDLLADRNSGLIRGLVWAAGVLGEPWLPAVAGPVAGRWLRLSAGRSFRWVPVCADKVPLACFDVLARAGSDECLRALARVGRATSHRTMLKRLRAALEQAAAARGQSAEVLLDHLLPDHGLDPAGRLAVSAGGGRAAISLDDRQGAALDGPDAAALAKVKEVAELLAEVRQTVSTARTRIESLFTSGREWHVSDFLDCYVRHPVMRSFACRTVWTFAPLDGEAVCGIPEPGGTTMLTPEGPRPIPAPSLVTLLHPATAGGPVLDRFRRLALDAGIRQPVRQLWRETYRPSPAAEDRELYSGRYDGHILRSRQLFGLTRRRGWHGGFLSDAYDGGGTATARRDYPAAGLRVSWWLETLEPGPDLHTELCQTGRLMFTATGDAAMTPIPIADVPAELFSEAMRDLDLFVSVTTVASDPTWPRGPQAPPVLAGYWDRAARGGLDQLRASRRQALAPMYAAPGPDDRFQLTQRDLIIHGSLATYRIDLATAGVRMEPSGKWLSFDAKHDAPASTTDLFPWIPVADDHDILRRITVRATILASDEQLASRRLLRQIRHR
jgi:uncharacterized protein DUF4132